MKNGRQSKNHLHQHVRKFWVQKRQHHKEWISAETFKKIEERKRKQVENSSRSRAEKPGPRAYEEYSHTSKTAKKSIKADKREFMNMLTTEAEEAAHQENLRELYITIKKLSGKFGKPARQVKDKGGKPIPDEGGQKKRWMEHFEEILNRPAPQACQISHQLKMTFQWIVIHPPRWKYTRPSNS